MTQAVKARPAKGVPKTPRNTTYTGNTGQINFYCVSAEKRARYLDPKTSRWLSGDPALAEYIPLAPLGDNERRHNQNLPGMGGVFNLVNLHVYHYGGNNPIKYVDPDGRKIFMVGVTISASVGTGASYEVGIVVSQSKTGNWQVGTYQTSGVGMVAGMGVTATISASVAPFAQEIRDVSGRQITIGGTYSEGFALGGDVNIPISGNKKNFSISIHIGGGTPGAEMHGVITTTTVQLFGEASSFQEAWNKAIDAGMLDNLPENILEHFKKAYLEVQFFEQLSFE